MPYILILPIIIVIFVLYMRFEASWVEVTRTAPGGSKKIGLKVIQLSDIHVNLLRVSSMRLQRIIDHENPDAIIISGDCIDKERHVPSFIGIIKPLALKHRVFMCLGNHDYSAFLSNNKGLDSFLGKLQELGITILQNDSVCIEINNRKYNIIGIDDVRCGLPDVKKAMFHTKKDSVANIAFTHNPDAVFLFKQGQVDYLLSGHFHGGQIWAPFMLEFKTLRIDKLCRMGITRGMHRVNGISLYINRGLGNVLLPLRFLSRPEIAVFHMP